MLREPSECRVLIPATKPAHLAERSQAIRKRTGVDPYDTGTIDFGFPSDSGKSLAQQRRDTGRRDPYKAVIHSVADEHPR